MARFVACHGSALPGCGVTPAERAAGYARGSAPHARAKSALVPARRVTAAPPASRVGVVHLIAPPGAKTSVNELSSLATGRAVPRQLPENTKTNPPGIDRGGFGCRVIDVGAPSVLHQVLTTPASAKEYTAPRSVHIFALPRTLEQPETSSQPPGPYLLTFRPPWRCVYST